jgi:hypothetical protein
MKPSTGIRLIVVRLPLQQDYTEVCIAVNNEAYPFCFFFDIFVPFIFFNSKHLPTLIAICCPFSVLSNNLNCIQFCFLCHYSSKMTLHLLRLLLQTAWPLVSPSDLKSFSLNTGQCLAKLFCRNYQGPNPGFLLWELAHPVLSDTSIHDSAAWCK